MRFSTDLGYTSREDKPEYVHDKYESILTDSVLDVGADQGLLGAELQSSADYLPIGLGPGAEMRFNLEHGGLPFEDDSFHCVVCLEVLEHLDNIHHVFDELCRVGRRYVLISLPNPWASFLGMLAKGNYDGERRPIKFYYLSADPPNDRHKWFFGAHEADSFIRERAALNGWSTVQIDQEWSIDSPLLRRSLRTLLKLFVNREVDADSLLRANTWGVIEPET